MPETQEQLQYKDALALATQGVPLRVLVVAAMLTDDEDADRLQRAFPVLWEETMQRRFNSTDGSLPGDKQQLEPEAPTLAALDRDEANRTSLGRD